MGFHGMGFSRNSRALQRLLGFGGGGLRISGCVGFGCKLCRFMGQEL